MTVSSEAKRTLVKSPPELWSEVSDAESLARHLDGLQELKITRVEPETAVEWEADGASGSVRLQPSGFGTKVTLSLSREMPPTEAVTTEPEPASESAPEPEPVVDAKEPEPEPVVQAEPEQPASEPAIAQVQVESSGTTPDDLEPDVQPIAAGSDPVTTGPDRVESEPTPESSMPEPAAETPREGFFARLFKRRRKPIVFTDDSIDLPRESEPVALDEPEPEPGPKPAATFEPEPEPVGSIAVELEPEPHDACEAETEHAVALDLELEAKLVDTPPASVAVDLAALEAEMAEQDEAMLTAMLDRLGAAHHRPFSRS